MKPNLFLYWETPEELDEMPGYIQLCRETVHKHCEDTFKIQEVTPDNIAEYVEIPKEVQEMNNIALKADCIRTRLLYEYGGLWLDSDAIIMQDLKDTQEKIKQGYSFVGYIKLSHGDNNPSVNYMGCKPKSPVMERYIELQEELLETPQSLSWSDLGADTLEKALEGVEELHIYDEKRIQPIPWQEQSRFYRGAEKAEDIVDEDTLTCMIFNNGMKQRDYIPDLRYLNKDQLLDKDILLTRLIKYSLER